MTNLLNWRIWATVIVAFFLADTHWKAYTAGKHTVEAKWNAERLDVAKQTFRLLEQTTRTTTNLEAAADQLSKAKNATIKTISLRLAAALDGLRNRPERPADPILPSTSEAGANTGCTGAQLYRSDAEFLVREAARAEQLIADLAQCQARYEQARGALK